MTASITDKIRRNRNFLGAIGVHGPEIVSELPSAIRLEIIVNSDGVFLLRYGVDDVFCGDTWHQSIDEATTQALKEFQVPKVSWMDDA